MTESYFGTLKRHGVKLSLTLILGSLVHGMLYCAAIILFVIIAFLLITMFSAVPSVFDADANQIAENFGSGPGEIVLGVVLLFLLLLIIQLPNSFFTAGSFGAASACVFRDASPFGPFFSMGFRNLLKMFGQQALLTLFFIGPILLMIFFGALLAVGGASEIAVGVVVLLFFILSFVLIIGYLWVTLHSPLILVEERTGVWDSIRLAFRLTLRKPGQTLLSGLLALGIFMGIYCLAVLILLILFYIFNILAGGNKIIEGMLAVFGFLVFLFTVFYSYSAALLAIVHRYKTRLRSYLFSEDVNWEGMPGTTPGYVPNK